MDPCFWWKNIILHWIIPFLEFKSWQCCFHILFISYYWYLMSLFDDPLSLSIFFGAIGKLWLSCTPLAWTYMQAHVYILLQFPKKGERKRRVTWHNICDKMADKKFPGKIQMFPTFPSHFIILFVDKYSVLLPLSLMIYRLTTPSKLLTEKSHFNRF
jgi:hypothetical protein